MKFSVITAVFNRVDTVEYAISSLQGQNYKCFEHIVIDGKSTDGTLNVLKQRLDSRAVLISELDNGVYDALNKGIHVATGDVIGFLHSDDVFAADDVLTTVARAFSDMSIDAVYGDLQYVAKANPEQIVRHWRAGEYAHSKLAFGWMPPHPALFVRRSVVAKWGGFDTQFKISGDYDLVLRYLNIGRISLRYVPQVFVRMRTGGISNASTANVWRKMREDYCAIRRNNVGSVPTLIAKNLRKTGQLVSLLRRQ